MRALSRTQKLRIAWMALFHKRTPLAAKAMMIGGALYGLMPFDLIPDILPVLGLTDDAVVLVAVIMMFLRYTKSIRKELEASTKPTR